MNGFGYKGGSGGILSLLPPFVRFILIANVLVFVLELFLGNFLVSFAHLFDEYFSLIPFQLNPYFEGSGYVFYPWQLVTYQFMHGEFMHGGFWHLFFNMFGIWMFGSELERNWGSARFGMFYILSGIGAGLVQIFIADMPTVGASGALFGVLLGFGMSFPDRKILMFPFFIPIAAKYFVLIYGVIELLNGIFRTNSGVAHFAHVAGAVTGYLLLKFGGQLGVWKLADKWFGKKGIGAMGYNPYSSSYTESYSKPKSQSGRFTFVSSSRQKAQTKTVAEPRKKVHHIDGEEISQDRIDEILDKISATGYQSLTDKEKYILTELSKRI